MVATIVAPVAEVFVAVTAENPAGPTEGVPAPVVFTNVAVAPPVEGEAFDTVRPLAPKAAPLAIVTVGAEVEVFVTVRPFELVPAAAVLLIATVAVVVEALVAVTVPPVVFVRAAVAEAPAFVPMYAEPVPVVIELTPVFAPVSFTLMPMAPVPVWPLTLMPRVPVF